MLNYIWAGMILFSILVSVFTGRVDETVNAAFSGAGEAVTLLFSMLGIMCLWTGLMKIAELGGVIALLKKIIRPLTKRVFPGIPEDSSAMNAICANISANIFGLGNAATPLGISAIQKMKKYANGDDASDDMCMFVVMNTASLELIPTTVIAIRASCNSANATQIIPAVWIASICSLTVGIFMAFVFSRRSRKTRLVRGGKKR